MVVEYLEKLLEAREYGVLKAELKNTNEVDLAEWLDELGPKETLLIFRLLPKDLAAETFAELGMEQRQELLALMTQSEATEVLEDLYFNELIDTLEELPANVVTRLVAKATPDQRSKINQFLQYPEDSAGSVMTIEYMTLRPQMTAKEALEHIRAKGMDRKTVYTLYVTDATMRLVGFVSLRELIVADDEAKVEDLMTTNVVSVEVHQDREEVAALVKRYGFLALPVVDGDHRLIGIITIDEIMDVMEEEATEDIQRMAAMAPSEEEYLTAKVWTLAKNRIGWLMILMISSTLSAWIISKHQDVLDRMIILSTFIPMIIDSGGNSGGQSATLVIRALATGDVTIHDTIKVVWKEFRIALVCGVILAVVNYMRLTILGHVGAAVVLAVSLTILVVVMLAKIIGASLPLLAKKAGLDPALMAGPLITTIIDSLGLAVYFIVISLVL